MALFVLPIWVFPYFSTQDGPAHLENAWILARLGRLPILARYYEWNPRFVPNWLGHGVLVVLLQILPWRIAEKVLLSGCLVALAVAYRAALPPRARNDGIALLILPFAAGHPLHSGFVNFVLGAALYFAALRVFVRWRRMLRAWGLAVTALAMAVSHPVPLVVLVVTLGTFVAQRAYRSTSRGPQSRRGAARGLYARLAAGTLLAVTPGLAVIALFAASGTDVEWIRWAPPWRNALDLILLQPIVSVDARDLWIGGGLSLATLAAAILAWRSAPRRSQPEWLGAAVVLAAASVASPTRWGLGSEIEWRIQLFVFPMLAAWLGAQRGRSRVPRALTAVAAALSLAAIALHVPTYARLDAAAAEYASVAGSIAPGSTILPLDTAGGFVVEDGHEIPFRYGALRHAAGYVAVARDAVDLDNYEAATSLFPTRFREGMDPFVALSRGPGIEGVPPCVDLAPQESSLRADYVILSGPTAGLESDPCAASWLRQLATGYRLVLVTRPSGIAQLWRREQ